MSTKATRLRLPSMLLLGGLAGCQGGGTDDAAKAAASAASAAEKAMKTAGSAAQAAGITAASAAQAAGSTAASAAQAVGDTAASAAQAAGSTAASAVQAAGDAVAQAVAINPAMLGLFKPLPEVMADDANPITEEKITLGRMLYYENRLSKNHDLSCNSCHLLDQYGVDNQPTSPGHKGTRGARNSPSSYNAAGHFVQFWDGRAADVEAQAKGPVLNPVEMAMKDEAAVIATLKSMPGYVAAFQKAFPGEADPITYDNFAKAVGAFERKLVTPSPWDKFLAGDQSALTEAEKAGFVAFTTAGCIACHTGTFVGGSMYQKLGLLTPWPDLTDEGRSLISGNAGEQYFFKVPSLRNVAKTGPYLHDGSVTDLRTMVKLMANHQLGRPIDDATADSIVTFLGSLTGELPTAYIQKPELPASTATTPKPDPT